MARVPSVFTRGTYPHEEADAVYCKTPEAPLRVLKFGSSVLQTIADLPRIVGEIYRQRREGNRMIVVVSALAGETDELFGLARQAGGGSNAAGVADLVSLGEEKTAALLRIACSRVGLDAMVIRPEELCIHTSGCQLDAKPVFINVPAFSRLAAQHDLLIMPGFVGLDGKGARSLLGRGGSDFTAIFVGGEMGADCVRLYKDVDGVFDQDPAGGIDEALKFREVSWADCLEVARPLLQPRSMEYAQAKGVRLEVEAIGSDAPTRVGPVTRPPEPIVEQRRLRVALAGLGPVGQAVLARLRSEPRFKAVSILVRDAHKPRGPGAPALITDSLDQFLEAEADILVEATSDAAAARDLGKLFLSKGRHVVTANKRLVDQYLQDLQALATDGAHLHFSAAVGGGCPILETIALARRHGEVCEVQAVLSGTINFVLERLAAGADLEAVLDQASRAGFAEANLYDDLSGWDAAAKLRIMAAKCFSTIGRLELEVRPLEERLVSHVSARRERWVQCSTLTRMEGAIIGGVDFLPAHLAREIPILHGEQNYVAVRIDDGRTWIASGRGAGGLPTAEAVIADLYDIARGKASGDPLGEKPAKAAANSPRAQP
jgi:homoserine dehydrogenase